MDYKHNKEIVPLAKALRKNMTKEEKHLWYDYLKEYPIRFIRQKVIGKYIVDFYCAKAKLVVELDGSQHYEDKKIEKDALRTEFLEQYGLKVIRIPNLDINKNFEGVCILIMKSNNPSVNSVDSSLYTREPFLYVLFISVGKMLKNFQPHFLPILSFKNHRFYK